MKKTISLLLCVIIAFCLTSCSIRESGESGEDENSTKAGIVTSIAQAASTPAGKSVEYTPNTANAGWADDNHLFDTCLNQQLLEDISTRHIPVFKFETKAELENFKELVGSVLELDKANEETVSFKQSTKNYNDKFFKDNALILCYIWALSSSYSYGVKDLKSNNGNLCLYINQTNQPDNPSDKLSGWFVMAEVAKSDIENCESFDAQLIS